MNNQIKVTVIMPVYKVEAYVGRAIETIQKQTLKEWEFLIVDDGSPDQSGAICDEYARKDDRIRVIHQKNSGAPAARNRAMEEARGEYLYFMDGDDWAEETMLQDLYDMAKRDRAQLVISGFYIDTYYDGDQYYSEKKQGISGIYQNADAFHKAAYDLFDHNQLYSPWNKLYERAYIEEKNIRFPKTFWDDFPFVLAVIRDIERVSVTENLYYHFIRARAESETAAYRPNMYEKREEEHQWMQELYDHWGIHDENSTEMIARRYVERFIGCVENLTNKNCKLGIKEKRRIVKEMLSKKHLKECLRYMRPRSRYMAVLIVPLKWRNVTLTILEGNCISFVKSRNTKAFAKLKANR